MAEINKFMFRDYDIRGVAGEDLNPREAELIGKAFGTYALEKGEKTVVVGRDARPSSPDLNNALIKGITSTGCSVVDIGLASHGSFLFALRHLNIGTGGYVTASHNPSKFNGFKFVLKYNYVGGKQNTYLGELAQGEKFAIGKVVGSVKKENVLDDYVDFLKSRFKLERKMKIALDCGNGMGGLVAPRVFKELGCEVVELFCNIDCTFPNHIADPLVPENMKDLQEAVKKNNCEFGIAFDGDGDRIGAVDEKENILYGDQLGAVFSKGILMNYPGAKIIYTVICSQAFEEVVKKYGGVPIAEKVGHANVESAMHRVNSPLGVEIAGHIFFGENNNVDDALYAACKLLEIASLSKGPFSVLLSDYPHFFATPERRTPCPDGEKFQLVAQLVKEFKQEGYKVVDIDGAKVVFEDGWGIVRASNTAPQLSMRFEGKTEQAVQRIKALFMKKLTAHGVDISNVQ